MLIQTTNLTLATVDLSVVTALSTSDIDTAGGGENIGVVRVVVGGGVDGDLDPSEDTILNLVTEVGVAQDWVGGGRSISLLLEDTVDLVVGLGNLVGVVGVGGLDLLNEILVVEELSNVGGVATSKGVVGQESGVDVSNDVVVGSAAVIVTREEGQEGNDTILISALNTTKESGVVIGKVGGVTIARGDKARVDTGSIAAPNLGEHVGNGLAGLNIDVLINERLANENVTAGIEKTSHLLLNNHGDTGLALQDV